MTIMRGLAVEVSIDIGTKRWYKRNNVGGNK